jgi:glycerol-3-phosphate acyltransferase PlsY
MALVAFVVLFGYAWPVIVFAVVGATAIVVLHRHNIRRLVGGTEHRFELRRPRRA